MDEAGHVATGERASLAVSRERVLALALRDRVDHHARRSIGRPHEVLGAPIFARGIESALVVDLGNLAFDVARVNRGAAHAAAVELDGQRLPDGPHGVFRCGVARRDQESTSST